MKVLVSVSRPQQLPPAQHSLSRHVKLLLPLATWKGRCHAHPRDTRMGALGLVASSGPSRSPPLQAGKRQRRPLCLQCCRAGARLPIPCPHEGSRLAVPSLQQSAIPARPWCPWWFPLLRARRRCQVAALRFTTLVLCLSNFL